MKITILHDIIPPDAPPDLQDSLVQVQETSMALERLGCSVSNLAIDSDLNRAADELSSRSPDLVFNLVESIGGQGRFIHLAPELLENLGLPFCGAGAWAMKHTSNKLLAKERLVALCLPTPSWTPGPGLSASTSRYIVKSVWEHSSLGLDEDSVVEYSGPGEVAERLAARARFLGGECFAEEFIEGREFNLSILGGPMGPEVLPPAEIIFENFGPEKTRIVGYKAKWSEGSHEYSHTPRRFSFPARDDDLLKELKRLALACWNSFNLHGWARVDFRVDATGRPFILEINANPCLSSDAGFMAAAAESGLSRSEVFQRIIQDAPSNYGEEEIKRGLVA